MTVIQEGRRLLRQIEENKINCLKIKAKSMVDLLKIPKRKYSNEYEIRFPDRI